MAPAPILSVEAEEAVVASVDVEVRKSPTRNSNCAIVLTLDISGGRGGFSRDMGPPATVLELGSFLHSTEGEMVCESTNTKIPYFNAPVYLENKVIRASPT